VLVIATVSGLLVAVCFFAASATKLRHRALFAEGLTNAGLPRATIKPLSVTVPAVELSAAILLLVPASGRAGAFLAAAILAVFTLYVGRLLAQHKAVPCNCFVVRAAAAPVSGWTVARNAFLLACALLAGLTYSYRGLAGVHTHPVDVIIVILAAVCVFLTVVCGTLLRRYGDIRTQLAHLQSIVEAAGLADPQQDSSLLSFEYPLLGSRLPDRVAEAAVLTAGASHLMLFMSTECSACQDILTALGDGAAARLADHDVRLIMSGPGDELTTKLAGRGIGIVPDADGSLTAALHLPGVPSALVVAADGTIGQFAAGAPAILSMLDHPGLAGAMPAIAQDGPGPVPGAGSGTNNDPVAAFEGVS
jgi:hypothetical protein